MPTLLREQHSHLCMWKKSLASQRGEEQERTRLAYTKSPHWTPFRFAPRVSYLCPLEHLNSATAQMRGEQVPATAFFEWKGRTLTIPEPNCV